MNLFKSTFVISFLTILARIAGYVRDMFIAAFMGAGPLTDAFLVAFRLPNFFRRLFAEGAFSAAFIPLFSSVLTEKGKDEAVKFVERTLSFLVVVLVIFTAIFQVLMPFVMYGIAPGFAENREQFDLAVELTRITFPYLLFISVVSLFGGVLNTLGKFASAAAAPILLNLCLIASLFLLDKYTETPAHSLSWGVAIAGVVQMVFLFFAMVKNGVCPKPRLPKLTPEVRKLLKLMVPGALGVGVVQINLWVDTIIATLIPSAVSYLYYADRLNQLPLAVIGTAIGTALLPMLSRQIKENKTSEALATQNRALELALFFTLPATAAFMVIAYPIISVLFERGEFRYEDSIPVAYALMAYATGLPAFVMAKIFTAPFFAVHDTKTPVKVAVICMISNIVLNIVFIIILKYIGFFPHIGIALATSVSGWLNIYLLWVKLKSDGRFKADHDFKIRLRGIILSTFIMAATLIAADYALKQAFADGQLKGIIALAILMALGGGTFALSVHFTRAFDFRIILGLLKRRKAKSGK